LISIIQRKITLYFDGYNMGRGFCELRVDDIVITGDGTKGIDSLKYLALSDQGF